MAMRIKNGRNEIAMCDESQGRFWSGTAEDGESQAICALTPCNVLISQFFVQPPLPPNSAEAAKDAEFLRKVRAVAASCLRSQKPDVAPSDQSEKEAFSAVWQFTRRIRDNMEVLGVEHHLFSDGAGVAGTADIAFRCNGRVYVCVWDVGDIARPAKCKFNAPFSHLVADTLTIHSLECSMNQVIADVGGYFSAPTFAPSRVLWLHTDECVWKVDAITCRDLRREAATMVLSRCYTPWYLEWKRSCPF